MYLIQASYSLTQFARLCSTNSIETLSLVLLLLYLFLCNFLFVWQDLLKVINPKNILVYLQNF